MVFDKMVAISNDPDFHISDPIQNLDQLQPNLFLTIQNLDKSSFQIPSVYGPFNGRFSKGLLTISRKTLLKLSITDFKAEINVITYQVVSSCFCAL